MRILVMAFALVMTAGSGGSTPAARPGDTITYHHEPGGLCLPQDASEGCADYLIVLAPSGEGVFERKRVAEPGPIAFTASPAQVAAFRQALQRYRPKGEVLMTFDRGRLCKTFVTEGDTIDIRWQPTQGPSAHLRLNGGCSFPGVATMGRTFGKAARSLPIADRLPLLSLQPK